MRAELFMRCASNHAVDEICQIAVHAIDDSARSHNLRVSISLTDCFTAVLADEARVQRALEMTLHTALRLTKRGGQVRLHGRVDWHDSSVLLMVSASPASDTVEGPELLPARDALKGHGGSIAVECNGEGGTIVISIEAPLASEDRPSDDRPMTDYPSSHEWTALVGTGILLAEDDENNAATMRDYLVALGYEVHVARDGAQAVKLARVLEPVLILMDVQMPGVDGLAAMRELRADPNPCISSVQIVALTALTMPGDRERCLAAGADEYVAKPTPLKVLAGLVERRLAAGSTMRVPRARP